MSLKYHPNLRHLMIGKGIQLITGVTHGITIYSGATPTAATIAANWSAYNSSVNEYLAHYSSSLFTHSLSGVSNITTMTTFPAAVLPTHEGVGSWAIIWGGNPTGAQLSSATLPFASFIVCSVSNTAGNGVIRFATDSFTTGVSKAIAEGTISCNLA